jgi:diaminopimelate epimerase
MTDLHAGNSELEAGAAGKPAGRGTSRAVERPAGSPSDRSRRGAGSAAGRARETTAASQRFYGERLSLTKYQALGNDYLVLDLPADLDRVVRMVPSLCDRNRGVGSDGLLAFDPARLSVRIFNPDGSEAEKSGNGLRIAACHAVLEHGAGERFQLRTRQRANPVRVVEVDGNRVVTELQIGRPTFDPDKWVFVDTLVARARCRLVSVGNPHCVVFGEPVTAERCLELGPLLERHPLFPNRTNVQLAEVIDRGHARIEVWERGAGRTLASGTSASAVAAVLIHMELTESTVAVEMPGGTLAIRQEETGELVQSGPAQRVFRAEVDLADIT